MKPSVYSCIIILKHCLAKNVNRITSARYHAHIWSSVVFSYFNFFSMIGKCHDLYDRNLYLEISMSIFGYYIAENLYDK